MILTGEIPISYLKKMIAEHRLKNIDLQFPWSAEDINIQMTIRDTGRTIVEDNIWIQFTLQGMPEITKKENNNETEITNDPAK